MIAPIGNISKHGSGVQIGLVNSWANCSGLQIGLLNQNGKKVTPIFSYRSRKHALKMNENAFAVE
ncbi:MAG TPA: hypothetical protein VN721_04295 [Flavipsychrobacter sp.]|nr:hypothetical protein [Flavipsychrobacter sp.]